MPSRAGSVTSSRAGSLTKVAAVFVAGMVGACHAYQLPPGQPANTDQDFALIERGRYLAVVADCTACHTTRPDSPFAGGRPIETPFGILLAPNITPDRVTGIGSWTDAQFDAAVRRGKRPDGGLLYPAMPYPYYARMSQQEVRAIWMYLKTVQPVSHEVHANQLPFPFKYRFVMNFWNALYFRPGPFKADPAKSPAWNRGAYVAESAAHCAACHTPKSVFGGDKTDQRLQGYSIQGWFAPNITNDTARGLSGWAQRDITTYLKTGHNRFAAASGPMAEEVSDSSSRMTDADLQAIAVYLKDRPGQEVRSAAIPGTAPVMQAGAAIYKDICSACHTADGTGVPYLFPNLAESPAVAAREPTTLLRVVLHGAQSVATKEEPTAPAMPSYGWQLTDSQIASVTTYIRNSWGHAASAVTAEQVRAARKAVVADSSNAQISR